MSKKACAGTTPQHRSVQEQNRQRQSVWGTRTADFAPDLPLCGCSLDMGQNTQPSVGVNVNSAPGKPRNFRSSRSREMGFTFPWLAANSTGSCQLHKASALSLSQMQWVSMEDQEVPDPCWPWDSRFGMKYYLSVQAFNKQAHAVTSQPGFEHEYVTNVLYYCVFYQMLI